MVKSSKRTATVAPIAGIMSLQVIALELVTLKFLRATFSRLLRFPKLVKCEFKPTCGKLTPTRINIDQLFSQKSIKRTEYQTEWEQAIESIFQL
jgi:hypothetical protein